MPLNIPDGALRLSKMGQSDLSVCSLVQITLDSVNDDLRLRRLLCGKAPPFRGPASKETSSSPAGRLSLPAGEEESERNRIGRKGRAFPHSGAAEPRRALA